MITREIISKNIDEAIIKCGKPKYASMHTPKQIARYFNLKYEEIDASEKNIDVHSLWAPNLDGKVHCFTDKETGCKIYIPDEIVEKKTGLLYPLNSDYEDYLNGSEDFDNYSDEEIEEFIDFYTYPLKEFIKDYSDVPYNIRRSIQQLTFHSYDNNPEWGAFNEIDENGGNIILYPNCMEYYDDEDIYQNPRTVLYHELGHAFSSKLGFESPKPYDFVYSTDYLSNTTDYKRGRREDKNLNGDKYATEYGRKSKDYNEEQADVTMVMLLKALGKDDNHTYRIKLAKAYGAGEWITVDEFLERYPNRVEALNKYMQLDL